MPTDAPSIARKPLGPVRAVLYGALVVGSLDILDAMVYFGSRGVQPVRILQSIASGLLGRPAFAGGLATALLGLFLHFFIAFGIVLTYYAVSRRIGALTRHPVLCGIPYGVVVYLVMNFVVLPLSATTRGHPPAPVVLNGVLIHMFGVGLPSALFVRRSVERGRA